MNSFGEIGLSEMWPIMEEQLNCGKLVKFTPNGTSMLPMLRPGVDMVVLKKTDGNLKKYDLPLYRRADGKFVLHRVVGVKDDTYTMCGDNQCWYEKSVKKDCILAIVDSFIKDGKEVSCDDREYLKYAKKQVLKNRTKWTIYRLKAVLKRILKR